MDLHRWRIFPSIQILLICLIISLLKMDLVSSVKKRNYMNWSNRGTRKPISMSRIENTLYIAFVGPKGLPYPLENAQILGVVIPEEKENGKYSRPNGWNHHPTVIKIPTKFSSHKDNAKPFSASVVDLYPAELSQLVTSKTLTVVDSNHGKDHYDQKNNGDDDISMQHWKIFNSAYPPWSFGPPPVPAIRGPSLEENNGRSSCDERTRARY